jgi:hypothetical protein
VNQQTDSIEERRLNAVERNEETLAVIRANRAGAEDRSCGKGDRSSYFRSSKRINLGT